MSNGLRLAIGTFTRIPVPAPRGVDRGSARIAMLLAPLVGVILGAIAGLLVLGVHAVAPAPLLGGVGAVAVLAWLTRGLHWDGLADLADGLGSGAEPERALVIMRDPAVGAFGVLAVVLVLLTQAGAVASIPTAGEAALAVLVAAVAGRLSTTLSTVRGIPAATAGGLGAAVAGSVPRTAAAGLLVATLALTWLTNPASTLALLAGVAAGLATTAVSVRRLGGITGDVLGAGVEIATTASLVVSALLLA